VLATVRAICLFRTATVGTRPDGRIILESVEGRRLDEVVVASGFRPDLSYSAFGLRRVLLVVLCVTEIVSWGVLYHALPGPIAPSIADDTRWSISATTPRSPSALSDCRRTIRRPGRPVVAGGPVLPRAGCA
jgi:hypothetical protein